MPWRKSRGLPGGWGARRVLITGASGGIGQALVDELTEAGAWVLASGRDSARLEALATRHPGRVRALAADLSVADERRRLVEGARDERCDTLINAAGVNHLGLFEDQDDAAIEALIAVNLTATLQLTRALLGLLREVEQGIVVNLGSTFGAIGYPAQATYCATKFALRGFSQALRRELADTPVRVLHVAPRATRTAMNGPATEAMNAALGNAMDTPETVARRVRHAIEKGHEETQLGGPERLFVRLNTVLPRLVDRALRRQLPTIRRFAGKP